MSQGHGKGGARLRRDYELMYIVRPELDDEGARDSVKSVRTLLETNGAEIVKTTLWGKRRLAYEVKRLREGYYVLVVLRLDGDKVAPIERALRIHDTVFRHLLVLHEGEMPESDGELDVVVPPEPAAAAPDGEDGATMSAREEETEVDDEELSAAPAAVDDEDGEG
jgi:small subunit ribosomal protein S6